MDKKKESLAFIKDGNGTVKNNSNQSVDPNISARPHKPSSFPIDRPQLKSGFMQYRRGCTLVLLSKTGKLVL